MKENFEFNLASYSIHDLNPGCVELWTLGQQVQALVRKDPALY
ncbi:hypothetical protein [Pseudomonas syringae]|nr:hypothetical protein [Pseudomonas syringae]